MRLLGFIGAVVSILLIIVSGIGVYIGFGAWSLDGKPYTMHPVLWGVYVAVLIGSILLLKKSLAIANGNKR